MTLSNNSLDALADVLAEDFNCFLHEFYEQQFSELLADAAVLFVDTEFGAMDTELANALALRLMQRQAIYTETVN
ncbi:hypothetical protein SCREM2_gp71 [Synechococcus phage S-CREM2]|nr:hypothetical protein SCREM2_gp71 [Synechococcus phage S-CREM2]